MRAFLWLCACAAALASFAQGARAECTLTKAAGLPFTLTHGKLLVQGKVNGETATFIFDTGAATTALTASAVGHLNLRAVRGEGMGAGNLGVAQGVSGGVSIRPVEAQNVDIGGLRARNFAFLSMAREISVGGVRTDGLLSADLLANYDIDLDFPGGKIRLFKPSGDCAHPSVYLHGNLFSIPMQKLAADRSPHVTVDVDGHDLSAVVDTGAGASLIHADAAARIGLNFSGGQSTVIRGVGGQETATRIAVLPTLGLGGLVLQNWKVGVAAVYLSSADQHVDMILGMDVLTRLHPWISYSSNSFVFQFPPVPSPGD